MTSLYKVVFGTCPVAEALLAIIGFDPVAELPRGRYGRYRDCYLRRIDGELRVHLLTRNGGGNRPDYAAVTEWLRDQPGFVRDFDDSLDSTFLTYEFRIPPEKLWRVEHMITAAPELCIYDELSARWTEATRRLHEEPNHPEVQRILRELAPTLQRVCGQMGERINLGMFDSDFEGAKA